MVYKTESKKIIRKIFLKRKIKICLKRKIKTLESKRDDEIISFILSNPSQAARADNIVENINSDSLNAIELKIKALRRLLIRYSKN